MNIRVALAALNGLLAVGVGAFAAHVLRGALTGRATELIATAVLYQLAHAVAAYGSAGRHPRVSLAFGLGGLLFAGSLYLLALTPWRSLAWITPVGGVIMLAGWAGLLLSALRERG